MIKYKYYGCLPIMNPRCHTKIRIYTIKILWWEFILYDKEKDACCITKKETKNDKTKLFGVQR